MSSFRSKLLIFIVKHRHWYHREWRRPVVDRSTSIPLLRQRLERVARRFGRLPAGVNVSPVVMHGLHGEWIRVRGAAADTAILFFHGGGYVMGSCAAYRSLVAKVTAGTGIDALTFEYRLAPEHPYPAALDDALTAYSFLLSRDPAPSRILFIGDSGGGGLCLASLLAIRRNGLKLPAAAVAVSPWTDLTCSGASHARRDPLAYDGCFPVFSAYYAGEHDPANPFISPLFGALDGLPPLLLVAGENEVLLDDAVRFAAKARASGTPCMLTIGEGMVHSYPFLSPYFPEAVRAMDQICAFLTSHAVTPARQRTTTAH